MSANFLELSVLIEASPNEINATIKKNKPSVIQQIADASPTVKVIKAIGTGIENIKKEKAADVN